MSVSHQYGRWLHAEMRRRRLSRRQLAAMTGIHHTAISRMAAGHDVKLSTALALASVVGWPPFIVGPGFADVDAAACLRARSGRWCPALRTNP